MSFVQTPNGSVTEREIILTETTETCTYTGFADPGTATSAATWSIMRETLATGAITWANAGRYSAVWDNRATETYS